jgi:NadR type nicotinamide-nucleotide adenylyltransferase
LQFYLYSRGKPSEIFNKSMIKKIVVIGPESTGKSTLCEQLAKHYNTLWCAEYAREYLLRHGTDYNFHDLLTIAKGQLSLEDQTTEFAIRNLQSQIFIDTDMYVMKVWCEYVFGKCHQFILDEIVRRKYDLYLLCKPDIAWVKDELREYPDEKIRIELYHIYRDILINQSVPWIEVSGDYEERLRMGVEAVEKLI